MVQITIAMSKAQEVMASGTSTDPSILLKLHVAGEAWPADSNLTLNKEAEGGKVRV